MIPKTDESLNGKNSQKWEKWLVIEIFFQSSYMRPLKHAHCKECWQSELTLQSINYL